MHRSPDGKPVAAAWHDARRAHSRLVDGWLRTTVDVVIVDGPFFDERERRLLLEGVGPSVAPLWVTLDVGYPVALARVTADATRALSRDPAFLRRAYNHFVGITRDLCADDIRFDTGACTVRHVVDTLLSALSRYDSPGSDLARPST